MPTGYTYPVTEGTVTEFSDFAMQCARAFGACVTMRDDTSDAPIPDEFKPSDWNEKRLAECRTKLATIQAMSIIEIADAAACDAVAKQAAHDKYEAAEQAAERRLDQMLEKVRAWEPPTAEHVGLKDFMIEQLTISKRGSYRSEPPKRLTASEWQREQIESLTRDIGYHATEQAKEIERARGRTEWIKALRASLSPSPESAAA